MDYNIEDHREYNEAMNLIVNFITDEDFEEFLESGGDKIL